MKPEREAGMREQCEAIRLRHENGEWGPWTSVQACQMALITAYRAGVEAQQERDAPIREALRGILDIGKRDMTNPKYDGYFESAEDAIRSAPIEGEKE